MDEPTNYLDTDHILWLSDYLSGFRGAFIVISHDYDFLQKITNCICDISFNKITKYRGDFKQAMRQKQERQLEQQRSYNKQQVVIEKAEDFIRKNKAGQRSTMAKSREKMLTRMDKINPPSENLTSYFDFPYVKLESSNVLSVDKLVVGYENNPILKPLTFSMGSHEKIAFSGFNGVGKSTLIKSILNIIPKITGSVVFSPAVKINYFSQELDWDDTGMSPLELLHEKHPGMVPKEIRSKLSKAGINSENSMKQLELLSGGEQTKVKIALLELINSNFLIMDEPTNHLDKETKNALSMALKKFEGSIIVVSHEESFYSSWINKKIDVEKFKNK